MKFIIILILLVSCSVNYSLHERNMKLQNDGMIKQDLIMKNKMIKIRKQGVRSYSKVKKVHNISNRKFI
jgi:hypothetical protein